VFKHYTYRSMTIED